MRALENLAFKDFPRVGQLHTYRFIPIKDILPYLTWMLYCKL